MDRQLMPSFGHSSVVGTIAASILLSISLAAVLHVSHPEAPILNWGAQVDFECLQQAIDTG